MIINKLFIKKADPHLSLLLSRFALYIHAIFLLGTLVDSTKVLLVLCNLTKVLLHS